MRRSPRTASCRTAGRRSPPGNRWKTASGRPPGSGDPLANAVRSRRRCRSCHRLASHRRAACVASAATTPSGTRRRPGRIGPWAAVKSNRIRSSAVSDRRSQSPLRSHSGRASQGPRAVRRRERRPGTPRTTEFDIAGNHGDGSRRRGNQRHECGGTGPLHVDVDGRCADRRCSRRPIPRRRNPASGVASRLAVAADCRRRHTQRAARAAGQAVAR